MKTDRVYAIEFHDKYQDYFHTQDPRNRTRLSEILLKKGIDYRVIIDLHDMTPAYKGLKDDIKRGSEREFLNRGEWAPMYIDRNYDVVYSGMPHILLMLSKNNTKTINASKKFLMGRQEDLPNDRCFIDKRNPALDYLEWYKGWKNRGLKIKPAGIFLSELPEEELIGKNVIFVEFVSKVDYLRTLKNGNQKNGNVERITIKEGCEFVNSIIDYFIKNPL